MNSSPDSTAAEMEAYEALQYYTLAHAGPAFIHQHVVDAWAAQHAGCSTKPITLTFALIGLYLHVEQGYTGREVQRTHLRLARRKHHWPRFTLPGPRGALTAIDIMSAEAGLERDRAIDAWCGSVWSAFLVNRCKIMELLQHRLNG